MNNQESWADRFDQLGITFSSSINRDICKQFLRQEIDTARAEGYAEGRKYGETIALEAGKENHLSNQVNK